MDVMQVGAAPAHKDDDYPLYNLTIGHYLVAALLHRRGVPYFRCLASYHQNYNALHTQTYLYPFGQAWAHQR